MTISVLCFSKDRPLQLEAYLSSLFRSVDETLPVTVLYSCGERFDRAYGMLASHFPQVEFVRETHFEGQVLECLQKTRTPLFMFGVDDVVFKCPWKPGQIWETFQALPGLLAFSLRLGKEITYCFPVDRVERVPDFLAEDPFLVWRWPAGELDWGYPWESCCTVYTTQFVKSMLMAMEELDWAHPNRLEGQGARLIRSIKELDLTVSHPQANASVATKLMRGILVAVEAFDWRVLQLAKRPLANSMRQEIVHRVGFRDLMASYPLARASVVTINRVQDVAPNRIYEGGLSADALLEKWNGGMVLDIDAYANRSYSSIYVGEAHLSRRRTGVETA